ncbi:MAG: hypothetical protein WCZ43_01055 [Proteiniphilum sp.]
MNKKNIAKRYFSGFEDAHETYNAISEASDGNIYYVLCSQKHDVASQLHKYNPNTDQTEFIADLSEVVGEKAQNYISQGKSHTEFYEVDGKLYFATHVGYYEMIDGAQQLPVNAPEGYKLYPGGHFLSYDLKTKEIKDLAMIPDEGVLSMTMDKQGMHLYGISWPSGYFYHYDIRNNVLTNAGLISGLGERGKRGDDYRVLCRSLVVDPATGHVYYSTSEGDIFYYDPATRVIKKLEDLNLRLDYFGKFDPRDAGSMGYNWRKIQWYEPENKAYGVHGNSGYLFSFDPQNKKIEIVDRITSEPSRKSGMFDQFSYGYLGFKIKDGIIYYLTGAPIYKDGKRVAGVDKINMGAPKGLEHLHLVTYNIPEKKYEDHGPIFYEDGNFPTYVNSIAVGDHNEVYTIARFIHNGIEVDDLIKVELQ